jgi:CheY-like chemotaxis protein
MTVLISVLALCLGAAIGSAAAWTIQGKNAEKRVEEALHEQAKLVSTAGFILRTPLNHLLGFVSSLTARSHKFEEDDKALIGRLLGAGGELKKALIDVLDVFELETKKLEIVRRNAPLHETINTAIRIGQKKAEEKKLYLNLQADPQIEAIYSYDDTRVRQCLDNLINQSIAQTIRGGVTVKAQILAASKETNDEAVLSVSVKDSSSGMDQFNTEYYFNPAHEVGPSFLAKENAARVNLALTRGLARHMGGDIIVKSAFGSGVSFIMTLPIEWVKAVEVTAKAKSKQAEARKVKTEEFRAKTLETVGSPQARRDAAPENAVATKAEAEARAKSILEATLRLDMLDLSVSERGVTRDVDVNSHVPLKPEKIDLRNASILVVDDNSINLEVLQVYLAHLGAVRITEAEDGQAALDAISRSSFDVIFMDMHMPDMTGTETTQKIRQAHPNYKHIPIIACTAAVDSSTRRACRESGMDNFLPKPVNIEELKLTLKDYFVV